MRERNEDASYKRECQRYGQEIYSNITDIRENEKWRISISEMNPNGSLIIYNIFPIQCKISNQEINILFNDQITESIRRGIAVAVIDTSVTDYHMRVY